MILLGSKRLDEGIFCMVIWEFGTQLVVRLVLPRTVCTFAGFIKRLGAISSKMLSGTLDTLHPEMARRSRVEESLATMALSGSVANLVLLKLYLHSHDFSDLKKFCKISQPEELHHEKGQRNPVPSVASGEL